jgi:hypothetical protein
VNFLNIFIFDVFIDHLFLQFVLLLLLALFVTSNNNYYSLVYLFLLILFLGVMLCFLNNELTAGFLWVGEFLVVFVFLLLILYVNVHGDTKKIYNKNVVFYLFIYFLFVSFYEHDTTLLENSLSFLQTDLYWVDYYEALNDFNNNDLYGFYVSYYILNNLILMLFGIILFFGSIVCVLLFRTIKVIKFNSISSFFSFVTFSQSFLFSLFMRKQDMFDQNYTVPSVKSICSKND